MEEEWEEDMKTGSFVIVLVVRRILDYKTRYEQDKVVANN